MPREISEDDDDLEILEVTSNSNQPTRSTSSTTNFSDIVQSVRPTARSQSRSSFGEISVTGVSSSTTRPSHSTHNHNEDEELIITGTTEHTPNQPSSSSSRQFSPQTTNHRSRRNGPRHSNSPHHQSRSTRRTSRNITGIPGLEGYMLPGDGVPFLFPGENTYPGHFPPGHQLRRARTFFFNPPMGNSPSSVSESTRRRNEMLENFEQYQLRLAQQLSERFYLNHTASSYPDVNHIKPIESTTENKPGYTSEISKTKKYMCPLCNTELSVGFPKEGEKGWTLRYRGISDSDRDLSTRCFFSVCGHVYCGWCVNRIINRKKIKHNVKPKTPVSRKRRKGNDSKKTDQSEDDTGDDTSNSKDTDENQERLLSMYIPASCCAENCLKQLRAKSFTEIYLQS